VVRFIGVTENSFAEARGVSWVPEEVDAMTQSAKHVLRSLVWLTGTVIAIPMILSLTSCTALVGALAGVLFTSRFCDRSGACGVSGHLLRSSAYGVSEFSPRFGEGGFVLPDTGGRVSGLAFGETVDGLRLYLATDEGLQTWDGRRPYTLIGSHDVTGCSALGDIVVLEDGDVIVSCPNEQALVRLNPSTGEVDEHFDCCRDVGETFTPIAVARDSAGRLYSGSTEIYAFDTESGETILLAIPGGTLGAETYDDFEFGPNGNLYVSANPDIGILEFDGSTFELLQTIVPGGIGGVPMPGALTFGPDGTLFVSSKEGLALREFDVNTGGLVDEWLRANDAGNRLLFMAFRP
jgi:hypothetical protein